MQIVSENSEADLVRKRALSQIGWALRDLTANLIRVSRGAGPHEIGLQAEALIEALVAYRDAAGNFPWSEDLANILTVEPDPEIMERMNDDHLDQVDAEQAIIRGSLQIAASRLLGQELQESAGHRELYGGLRELEGIRAERRKSAKRRGDRRGS
jgi:hypothetical protein